MTIVIDTNLFVSSFFGGPPKRLINKCFQHEIQLCYSSQSIHELKDVLFREKFKQLPYIDKIDLLQFIYDNGALIHTTSNISLCRDPKDNIFLELAVDGHADYIVSGDEDLLSLGQVNATPILSVDEILKVLDER